MHFMERFKFYAVWLCLICIGMFILQNLIPGFTDALILDKQSYYQPWRFLTSIFLHGGWMHLLYNLFALGLFGSILEKLIGGRKFLAIFFLAGIFANLVAVNFYASSLGASGAIYGVLGCLAFIRPGMAIWAFGLPMPMFIAVILWIAGSVIGIFVPSNVGDIAHLSGIVIGLLFGLVLRLRRKPRKTEYNYSIKIPEDYIRDWERRYMK